jgi:P-type E1-E2 ATPase
VLKKDVYILSGDSRETVAGVGEFLNLPPERVIGETDAEGKVALLRELRNKHGVEALMIGDGLNDVLCLQEAHVGVAINAKSELNLIACDVIALSENLWKIPTLFVLLKKARLFIIANLLWAFAYNLFAMPAAAGVFVPFNVQLSSVAASAFMSGSSLIVVLFSNLMRFI